MRVSIIVPAFNEAEFLQNSIAKTRLALVQAGLPLANQDWIVCDNNSSDRTAQIAAELGANVVFEAQQSIARARNQGASAAEGEHLLFFDADSYASPELAADLLRAIEDPSIAGGGSMILVFGGSQFNKLRMQRMNPIFRLFGISGGAFLFCRADVFRDLGGFAEHLYALEDLEFSIRLKRQAKRRQQRVLILHEHPVFTSGRCGEMNLPSLLRLYFSNFLAVLVFLLSFILPKSWIKRLGSRLFSYWYQR
jgi:glycosyltransferase involved in cell wall biosynthesis